MIWWSFAGMHDEDTRAEEDKSGCIGGRAWGGREKAIRIISVRALVGNMTRKISYEFATSTSAINHRARREPIKGNP
jgi:hypothetical protein